MGASIGLIKSRIKDHFIKCHEEDMKVEMIRQHLIELDQDALIPQDVIDWCYDELDKIHDGEAVTKPSPPLASKSVDEQEPLFCKETVYHASLCALVVMKGIDILGSVGHNFKKVSLSKSQHHKLSMAIKDDDVVYIAFQGETNIEKWLDYPSLLEGIHVHVL